MVANYMSEARNFRKKVPVVQLEPGGVPDFHCQRFQPLYALHGFANNVRWVG